jgi:hypothetical protein
LHAVLQCIEYGVDSTLLTVHVKNLNKTIESKFRNKSAVGNLDGSKEGVHDFKYWLLNCFCYQDRLISHNFTDFINPNKLDIFQQGFHVFPSRVASRKTKKTASKKHVMGRASYKIREREKAKSVYEAINRQKNLWHAKELPKPAQEQLRLLKLFHMEKMSLRLLRLERRSEIEQICNAYKFTEHLQLLLQMIRYYPHAGSLPETHVDLVINNPMQKLTILEKQYMDIRYRRQDSNLLRQVTRQNPNNRMSHFLSLIASHYQSSEPLLIMQSDLTKNLYNSFSRELLDLKRDVNHPMHLQAEARIMANAYKNGKSATRYLYWCLKNDVSIIRLQLEGDLELITPLGDNSDDRIKNFTMLVTKFLSNMKRSRKPVGCYLLGHIGSYVSLDDAKVDLVLVFEAQNIVNPEDLIEKVITYWKSLLPPKAILHKNVATIASLSPLNPFKSKEELTHKFTTYWQCYLSREETSRQLKYLIRYIEPLSIESLPIMASIADLNQKRIEIFSTSTVLKSLFIKNIVDYYCAYPLFLCDYDRADTQQHMFLKGRITDKLVGKPAQQSDILESTSSAT